VRESPEAKFGSVNIKERAERPVSHLRKGEMSPREPSLKKKKKRTKKKTNKKKKPIQEGGNQLNREDDSITRDGNIVCSQEIQADVWYLAHPWYEKT